MVDVVFLGQVVVVVCARGSLTRYTVSSSRTIEG